MLQSGRDLDLPEESLHAQGGAEVGTQHLHRHRAAVLQVSRQIHRGHAAPPDHPLEGVALGQGGAEGIRDGGHSTKDSALTSFPRRAYHVS